MSRLLVLALLLGGSIYAQHQHETAKKPRATLLAGMGRHHHPIRASAEAQKFFDEGLTLVFGFNHEESIRSFERAIAIVGSGGLLSIKAHFLAESGSWRALDGLTPRYRDDLDRLFGTIEERFGDKIWWTSMGEMAGA